MISFTPTSFTECEVHVELPTSNEVYCVQAFKPWPHGQPGADWAWDEPDGHYICEFKDPESGYGLEDDDGIDRIVDEMDAGIYYWGLVNQFAGTIAHHPPSAAGARAFFALVCIDGPLQPDWGAAVDSFAKALRESNHDVAAAIVNISLWNELLAPRRAFRTNSS